MDSLKNQGQSTVIGAVLMFGMLIVAFSIYHSTFVPNEFKSTEIDHNEEIQGDLLQLSDKIRGTATNGVDSSQTMSYGGRYSVWTAYPSPPLYGATRTPQGTVTFDNVTVTNNGESNDYWDTQKEFSTHSVRYEPAYREYQNPPTTVIEHGSVYNDFRNAQLDVSSQDIVSNDSVNLILIGGDLNETSAGSERVSVNSVSSSDSTTQVNGEFTFTILTDREESYWEYLDDRSIVETYDYRDDEIEITINSDSPISLTVTRVSFDSEKNSVEYITIEKSEVVTKDKYGNPIGGVEVTVDETGETYFSDGDGTVNIPSLSQTIHPYIHSNSSDQEFVTVESGDLGGGGSVGSDPVINTLSSDPVGNSGKYKITYDVSDPDGDLASIDFSLRDNNDNELGSSSTSISGGSASGESGQLNEGGSTASYVRVTVTDSEGNTKQEDVPV